jgi:anti-sigma-K factor RskA
MSDHEELENSIAAWVLGATEPDETSRITSHVAGCAGCREVVSRLRRTTNLLALEAGEVDPPARLRRRILAAAAFRATDTPKRPGVTARSRLLVRGRQALGLRPLVRVPAYAAAAVVLVALVAGVVGGEIAGHVTPPPLQNQVTRFTLVGHDSMAGARASVIDLKSDGVALVDFNGLPALAPGKVYELWLINAAKQVDPAGVFVPDSNGAKMVVVGKSLAGYVTMAVTTEVGPNGVQAPTQQPQLSGSVA